MEITRYFPIRKGGARTNKKSLRERAMQNVVDIAAAPRILRAINHNNNNQHMQSEHSYAGSNTIGVSLTNDGNHFGLLLPSCSYKLEQDENSCDSGISMSSNCSSSNEPRITNFASLHGPIEIEGFVLVDKPELSDGELETERKLQQHIDEKAERSERCGLSDMTNKVQSIPIRSGSLSSEKSRKRSAEIWRVNSEKKNDASEQVKPKRIVLRRSQSVIETYLEDSASTSDIPHEHDDGGIAFQQINGETLTNWMKEPDFFDKYYLVDCRYPYEYNGGHIKGATNCWDPDLLHTLFYPFANDEYMKMRSKIPIFYCEFSVTRGPRMAKRLRSYDRHRNLDNYPELDYRQIYVLQNGYREFFSSEMHRSYCEPQEYIKMRNSNHVNDLKRFSFHKSKSFSGTSVFKNNARHMKAAHFRVHHQSESSLLAQKPLPTIPDFFEENPENMAAFNDGLAEAFILETEHFSQLRMASPSPQAAFNRPPTRRAVFPPL